MKKLIISLFVILPFGLLQAQEIKIAHVNFQEVLLAMPEISNIEKEMAKIKEEYQKELETMQSEYQKKYADYIAQQDSLTENIKLRRQQDIQDIQERMNSLYELAQKDVPEKQQKLIQPVQEKVLKAIKEIGDEKGLTYIVNMEPGLYLYTGNSAVDVTPLVKTKLGIK
ncbi:MAG: OmpH family outer membrane protein [Tannerellaceae bacterium]|jgi:outer membrane protein|nr:OmpH family outer membrane protein [Tannerellaceae bacterium]